MLIFSSSFMPRISPIKVLSALIIFTLLTLFTFNIWIESNKNESKSYLNYLVNGIYNELGFKISLPSSQQGDNYFKFDPEYSFLSWNNSSLPWFMTKGTLKPDPNKLLYSHLPLWPEQEIIITDRIINQLMYIPYKYNSSKIIEEKKIKKILYYSDENWRTTSIPIGQNIFKQNKCPVDTCEITIDTNEAEKVDAIFFKDNFVKPTHKRPFNQIWILYLLECPMNTQSFTGFDNLINWTATYRHDSDIVTPYEKFVLFEPSIKIMNNKVNYAKGKKKKVAWFVSNCGAKNQRFQYAKELSRYIQVDIFGRCGDKRCPRSKANKCFQILKKDYKFYLAFENSNCRDYITEKFFFNGLSQDIVPIVMGAHPDDYRRVAPFFSYIHVNDFDSPKSLGTFLHLLDSNDTLYNSYFRWKYTGQLINTYFWCRLCSMLHAPIKYKTYSNLADWWKSKSTCTKSRWR